MKKTLFSFVLTAALILSLAGCGKAPAGEPQAASSGPAAGPGRQDGERFEAAIVIEGMEETVLYEHIRNETVGFEMDYDCEQFTRQSRSDRERFVSVWDDPDEPTNYIEVTYSPQDANAAAASVGETLSADYEIVTEPWELDRAGSCIRIDASEVKGGGYMPDLLQTVYIIPAPDGSRIAAAHCTAESAEGFGRRVAYMMDTLAVVDRNGEKMLSDEQALSAVRSYCYSRNPELEGIVNAGEYPAYWEISSSDEREIVVLFRSYTGSETRYYIDRAAGEAYTTEFVPGITPREERTEETINVWDYLG